MPQPNIWRPDPAPDDRALPLTAPAVQLVVPTLGAALVIHAGNGGQSLAGRVLGVRPLVLAGLISYSLYLWHWPMLVFARTYVGRELSMAETLAVLALSVAVAFASWRCARSAALAPFSLDRNYLRSQVSP